MMLRATINKKQNLPVFVYYNYVIIKFN